MARDAFLCSGLWSRFMVGSIKSRYDNRISPAILTACKKNIVFKLQFNTIDGKVISSTDLRRDCIHRSIRIAQYHTVYINDDVYKNTKFYNQTPLSPPGNLYFDRPIADPRRTFICRSSIRFRGSKQQ